MTDILLSFWNWNTYL